MESESRQLAAANRPAIAKGIDLLVPTTLGVVVRERHHSTHPWTAASSDSRSRASCVQSTRKPGKAIPTGHVKVTSNGVCDGKGVATLTDTPANRAVGLPPLERVSIRDHAQNVTIVFTFQSAPPQAIPGASSYAFFTQVGSGVTNAEGHSTLIVASGGTQLQPGWTSALEPPGGTITTSSTAVVDTSARTLTATLLVSDLSIPFLWSTNEIITPNSDPSAEYGFYVCPTATYSG